VKSFKRKLKEFFAEDRGDLTLSGGIGILIMLVLVGGILLTAQRAFSSYKLMTAQRDIAMMKMHVQSLYAGSSDYTGLSNTVGISAGVFPSDMIKGATVKNAWGGQVTLAPGTDVTQFTISYSEIPQDVCLKIAQLGDDWASIAVNGVDVMAAANRISATAGACQDGANTVVFGSN